MSRKEKKKKTYFINADGGHVGLRKCGVWTWMCCVRTWMCCVWVRMSRKERKKKKITYFSADVDALRVDADE